MVVISVTLSFILPHSPFSYHPDFSGLQSLWPNSLQHPGRYFSSVSAAAISPTLYHKISISERNRLQFAKTDFLSKELLF